METRNEATTVETGTVEDKPRFSISQSFLKAYKEYGSGEECGKLIQAKYIDKTVEFETTDAMNLGNFFEFLAEGSIPRSGEIPMPTIKSKPKKTPEEWAETLSSIASNTSELISDEVLDEAEKDLYVDYYRVMKQVNHWRNTSRSFGIEVLERQKVITIPVPELDTVRKGIIDLHVMINKMPGTEPHEAFIDLKCTGNIDGRWEDYGWDNDSLARKDKITIQPVDYVDLARRSGLHPNMPFYFYVADNKTTWRRKIFQVYVGEGRRSEHDVFVANAIDSLKFELQFGLKAKPHLDRCMGCPLLERCASAAFHPEVVGVML